jgi:hypothetical protein
MAYIAFMIGGLIPTLLISRLLLLITKKWPKSTQKLLTIHAISLIMCSLIGGMGMADGGAFVPLIAASMYAIPQVVWLVIDVLYFYKPWKKKQ